MPEEPAYQEGEFEHAPSHSAGSSSDLYSSRAEDEPAAASYAGSELAYGHNRAPSFAGSKGGRKDALGILLRLAEALEMDDGSGGAGPRDPYDSYGSYADDGYADEKGMQRHYDPELLNSFDSNPKRHLSYGYAAGRNWREESLVDEEDAMLEYTASPWNAADVEATGEHDPYWDSEEAPAPGIIGTGDSGEVRHYKRQRRTNWTGLVTMFVYLVILGFYVYVLVLQFIVLLAGTGCPIDALHWTWQIRVAKTMDLGKYLIYGVIVFGIEMLGATTTLLYGVNLLMHPVHETFPRDEAGKPQVMLTYHVRILIPCYKESLELIARTCSAALEAVLPDGCARTVYLCDDGGDITKRKWVQSKAAEKNVSIVYISGRKRTPGEMNGKSANLNNCLRQVYPGDKAVPPNELVCIFDADQVANKDFFTKTIPLFDAGDDVGMVLSPQAFFNLNQHADIFNHANIHFWEYAQHGYDALGFISCTGTNFLIRSNSFKQANWSPEYTLTEDYALGMVLKQNKWHCRYVEEYLAIGEAPEQVRNCFQQRSRWCKGHFQLFFSRHHCPLLVPRLSFGMRILYCSGVWSYIVGAITTPLYIIIPLLTIWVGVFPIAISWWAALALTMYYIAQSLVLNYCKKWWHIEALWFANISNAILWFTYVKGCFRVLSGMFGSKITFKTTLKGAGKLLNSAIGDLWMPFVCLVLLIVSFGKGLQELINGPTVITTLSISLVWIIYAAIPCYLVLHYTWIGRGTTLQFMCRVCFLVSYAAGLCALLLLWGVYPRTFDFGQATADAYQFYQAQMVGNLPSWYDIPWRSNALTYDADTNLGFSNLTGGWCEGGEIGCVKMTMPTAFTVSMMAWSLLAFPKGHTTGGTTTAVENQLRWGTDYLLKTWRTQAAQNANQTDSIVIAYQVGNWTQESTYWGRPEDLTAQNDPRPAYNVSMLDGASDIGGMMAAAFSSAAIVFNKSDSAYSQQLLSAASSLYVQATTHQGSYSSIPQLQYNCVPKFAKSLVGTNTTANCPAPQDFANGSALMAYNSTTFYDDLTYAAAWLYKATGNSSYLNDAQTYYAAHLNRESDLDGEIVVDWNQVYWASALIMADLTNAGAFHMAIQTFLDEWVCGAGGLIKYTPRGRAWNPNSPSLGATTNAAFLSAVYANLDSNQYTNPAKTQKYQCWSLSQTRYVLGDAGAPLMVGWGKGSPDQPQNMAASCPSPPAPCNVSNLLVDKPNPHVLLGAIPQFETFSDKLDDLRTLNDTRVSLSSSIGFAAMAPGMVEINFNWEACLQGYGIFTQKTDVCTPAGT